MKIVAKNKRGKFDYNIEDVLTAGLALKGSEVKSVKHGAVSLKGSYVRFVDGRPVLTGSHISLYRHAFIDHDPERDRSLLLHKQEIKRLVAARQNGKQIVPLAIGIERGLIKLEIGIGTPRKKHDKRQVIKERDSQRHIERAMKR